MLTFSEDVREIPTKFHQDFEEKYQLSCVFMKIWMNNLFKFFKNDKFVTTFSLKFWDLSGAKVWKSCRSRKSWKNEYLVAIVAVDTAKNEPLEVWGWLGSNSNFKLLEYSAYRIIRGASRRVFRSEVNRKVFLLTWSRGATRPKTTFFGFSPDFPPHLLPSRCAPN